jgi:membrane associated rhomboid family serine protease
MTAEPWRAVTALTLHLDAAHAAGNAVAIAVVLPAVGQRFGAGVGVWLVLLGGAAGNLLAALLHAPGHMAAGASTAIFAAFGILGAARVFRAAGEERRWKPWTVLAASLALLALLGTSRSADVLAHGTGFLSGAIVGLGGAAVLRPFGRAVQWTLGLLTVLTVIGCWLLAG